MHKESIWKIIGLPSSKFNYLATQAVLDGFKIQKRYHSPTYEIEHLALAVLKTLANTDLAKRTKFNSTIAVYELKNQIKSMPKQDIQSNLGMDLSPELITALRLADAITDTNRKIQLEQLSISIGQRLSIMDLNMNTQEQLRWRHYIAFLLRKMQVVRSTS